MSVASRTFELEDTWNRREIKDCSDLLSLGKTVLPSSMLQIHYRSKYRELIAFSNAAFYDNHLSVPVRHPESVIQNIRPIEVIRVDGVMQIKQIKVKPRKLSIFWLKNGRLLIDQVLVL